jgi:hypothetical protein
MGLGWLLVSFVVAVTLWLGMDACRESKRLHARLSRVAVDPVSGESDSPDWVYRALTAENRVRRG